MGEIARRAGVVRATVYVHFPTREALIDTVTRRAISEVVQVVASAEPQIGDPADALRRVLAAAWRTLGGYHALVALNAERSPGELHDLHRPVLELLAPLIERGQRRGVFRDDVPVAWHLAMLLALVHAASAELGTGRLPAAQVESALLRTVLGAMG